MIDAAPGYLDDQSLANRKQPFRPDLFAGQRLLVTGGGSGIGKAIAWLFGRLGAAVLITGRKADKLAATAAAMVAEGLTVDTRILDIRDSEAIAELFQGLGQAGQLPDILVNNAGGQFPQAAIDFSVKGWNSVINTNLNGSWYMMQGAAQQWRDGGRPGCIVNIVTVVPRGMPGGAHTCAARAGVIHLSKTVAVEWAEYGIRVNCVAPGIIHSAGMEVYDPAARAAFNLSNPMKRFGSTWDVAQACAYLASSGGAFITGEVLTVDGGGQLWGELWMAGKPAYFSETDQH